MTQSLSRVLAACLFFALGSTIGCKPPTPPTPPAPAVSVSPTSFDAAINQDKLTLVKFGATWCPPCNKIDKELKKLEGQLPADVEVLKIDIDENPELATRYNIEGVPTMLIVRGGNILAEKTGYMDDDQIVEWIDQQR